MGKRGLILAICFLMMIHLAVAIEPQVNTNGLEISYPKIDALTIGTPLNLTVQVFNLSNGVEISYASCDIGIDNKTGFKIVQNTFTQVGGEYNSFIQGNKFSNAGEYTYNIYCNASGLGGFADGKFQATATGTLLDNSEAILYAVVCLISFILFGIVSFFAVTIPYSHKTDKEGAVIKISKIKYIKILCINLSFLFLVQFMNLLVVLANNYLNSYQFLGYLGFFFLVLQYLAKPVSIFLLVLSGAEVIRDIYIFIDIKKYGRFVR